MSPDEAVTTGMAPNPGWFEAEKETTFGGWRTLHTHARPGYTVRIAGASHMSFMDVPFLPLREGSIVTAMLAATRIAPQRMWRITSDLLLAFFARHLDGAAAPLLDGASADYPELTFTAP